MIRKRGFNPKAVRAVIEGTKAERKFLCGEDFGLFFSYYFVDYLKYPFAPFHHEMFDDVKRLMNGELKEVAWIMFRESAKSSIAQGFIVWLICYKRKKYINVDAYDRENSERLLFDIVLNLQSNPRIIEDFGQLYNAPKKKDEVTQKRVSNFVTNNGIRCEAYAVGSSPRGRKHGEQRPDFLLLDDFETNNTKDSEIMTKSVIDHINEFKGGLAPDANVIYLGNYISDHGSVQYLMERAKMYPKLLVRNVPVIQDDKPSWEAKYVLTDRELKLKENKGKVSLEDKKKELGTNVFNTEMMNHPFDDESQEFFTKWFRYIPLEAVLLKNTRKFVTIDTAVSQKDAADFTGITKNWVDEQNNWYFSTEKLKINPKTLIDLIFQYHEEGFEKIGIEETIFLMTIEPFFAEECRKRGKFPYIVKLKHGGRRKEERIRGLIPRYEAGKIYHIEGKCEALEEELLRFPHSLHDDVADSAQYQNDVAEPYQMLQSVQYRPNFGAKFKR